jgi:hypothetical protein
MNEEKSQNLEKILKSSQINSKINQEMILDKFTGTIME